MDFFQFFFQKFSKKIHFTSNFGWGALPPRVVGRTGLAHKIFFILSLNLLLSSMNKVELSQSKKTIVRGSFTLLEKV